MSSYWKEYTIDEVCAEIVDCVNKTATLVEYETPYKMIRTTNLKNGRIDLSSVRYVTEDVYKVWTRRSVPQIGDVILTREAPIGEVGMIKTNDLIFLGQRLMQYRANQELLDPYFLLYALQGPYLQHQIMSHEGSGSTVSHIRVPDAMKFKIKLPPLELQKKIGDILSSLDEKIELNLRMNETLEQMAMVLYKNWFVEFSPFQDGEFVESELGMIPKGWQVDKLGSMIKIKHGFAFKGKFFTDEGSYVLLTPGNFREQGGLKLKGDKEKFYNGDFPDDYLLKKGDLLVVMTDLSQSSPFLGSAAFITDDNVFLHNQRLGKILNTEKDNLDTEFLYHLLNSYHVRENIRQSASGTTVKHTSPDRFYSVLVVIPPKDIQEEFSSTVLGFREQIQLNGKENKHLENLRNYLLPRLLTGAIEVTVAEEQIEEALSSV